MKNDPTQKNTPAENAKPAKKVWQKPDFYIIDRNEEINGGPVGTGVEGAFTPNVPGAPVAQTYHS